MYTNRMASITHPFEAFIVPPVAEGLASLPDTNRCDDGFGNLRGFMTVDVLGLSFTASFYVQDDPVPRWTRTFSSAAFLETPDLLPDGRFRFTLNGEAGRRNSTEVSSNLVTWESIETNAVGLPGGMAVTNPLQGGLSPRFFRCVTVP